MLNDTLFKKQKENKCGGSSPILKWAGGKSQLLPVINRLYPGELLQNEVDTYIEPFIGGGAVFFDVTNQFRFKRAFIFDVNPELFILYRAIKEKVETVIDELSNLQKIYLRRTEADRKIFYYAIRETYNADAGARLAEKKGINPIRASQTMFLNRTCFNGLYRVNGNGHFNVPMGSYKNPTILFEEKLRAASESLQIAEIRLGDFSEVEKVVGKEKTFIYYDPPYRPISETSQFTSYAANDFNDIDQTRLGQMYRRLDARGVLQMLSNSDPTNYVKDPFFDTLYQGFNIHRINATRRINSDGEKRGEVRELLITNYKPHV